MKKIITIFFLTLTVALKATNISLVNISNYGVNDYSAGLQNWGLCINEEEGLLYVANNSGLLIFNGNSWKTYEMPNKESLRSVYLLGDKIYVSGDNCIGYWQHNHTSGLLSYHPLISVKKNPNLLEDSYWSIAYDGKYLYFQSFSKIVQYSPKEEFKILSQDCHMLFQEPEENEVFVHRLFGELLHLQDGKFSSFVSKEKLVNEELKFMLKISKDKYIFGTNKGSIFIKDKTGVTPFNYDEDRLQHFLIDCAELLPNNLLAIGTLGGGIFIYSLSDGKLVRIIAKETGLRNNTVHRLLYDNGTLWSTLDNGIASIKIDALMALFTSAHNIGNFNVANYFKGNYYIGTNEGLFKTKDLNSTLEKVKGVGEVLSLENVKGELLCGTNKGCYVLDDTNRWSLLAPIDGIYDFKYVAQNGHEYLVACTYLYITYFKYVDGKWTYYSSLSNFPNTLEQIVCENLKLIWALHPQKGILKIRTDNNLKSVTEYLPYKGIEGLTDYKHISIQKIDGVTYFFSPTGVYNYNPGANSFDINNRLTEQLYKKGKTNWVEHAKDNEYWVCQSNEIYLYKITLNEVKELGRASFLNYGLTQLDEKVHISYLRDDLYLFSSVDGAVLVDAKKIKEQIHSKETPIKLVGLSYLYNKKVKSVEVPKDGSPIDIPYNARQISFYVSKSIFAHSNLFKYKLEDTENNVWSKWTINGKIEFNKLSSGKQKLCLIDFYGNRHDIELNVYLPYYLSLPALILYVLCLASVAYYLMRRRFYKKKEKIIEEHRLEQISKDKQIIKLTNDKLRETVNAQKNDINNKLRAISQKQELLLNISNELDKQKNYLGDRYPNKMYEKLKSIINNGLSNDNDFILFQNYYQEINHDFLVKLKATHPELSSQDLKFCCLIRSNLSTKDVSSILNITPKSVELKRYRIKKKINIDDSLYDYLLSFEV